MEETGPLAATLQTEDILLMCTLPLRVMSRLMRVRVSCYCWINYSLNKVVCSFLSYLSDCRAFLETGSAQRIIGSKATERPVESYRPASHHVVLPSERASWQSCQVCRWKVGPGFSLLDSTGMRNWVAVVPDWQAVGLLSRGPVHVSDGSLPGPWVGKGGGGVKPREGSQVPFLKICPRSPGYQRERCSSFNSLKRSFFSLHLPQSFVLTSSKTCHVGQLWLSLAAVAGGQGAQEAVLVGSDADERTNKTVEKWEGAFWRPEAHSRAVSVTNKTSWVTVCVLTFHHHEWMLMFYAWLLFISLTKWSTLWEHFYCH